MTISPTKLRYIMISKVSSSKLTARPATAISEKDAMEPIIHRAARRALSALSGGIGVGVYSHSMVPGGFEVMS